ncbi:unnamed protein product (macronuclear) [Paramecium tetraurelia]|uniref:Uncharacterized protein n=1 Tax=Paramecium tetraurelia TaxID=5888 RepID=A0BMR5_PARTE|nr:uncharacterized protein GSPATT00030468001 [Paramecium tetraurelia]CAK59832.1 unnamed protein product [Paramecium tetraurelia]|eukprot:XP_001427230.1 hypothetical protein (macronuclear) [Paramecium tetraurelia strain d4-2]
MSSDKFTRIQIDQKHPQSNIYITTRDFLRPKNQTQKKQKLDQLALMDIVAIINLHNEEVLYEEIPHLNPTTIEKCEKIPFLENQGAVKLIDDVLKEQQKSVAIFCDETYNKSHQLLVCYLIYDNFQIKTDINKLDSLENRICEINFEKKEIALDENRFQIIRGFDRNSLFPNYRFKAEIYQMSEAQKFQQTQMTSQKTYSQQQRNLQYYVNGDNLSVKNPPNLMKLSQADFIQKYYGHLEEIKVQACNGFCSAIVLKKK